MNNSCKKMNREEIFLKTNKLLKEGFTGSLYQYIATAITTVFGLLVTIYVIRGLKIEEFGVYNFIASIIILAELVTSFGLSQIILRYLPEYKQKEDNYLQKRLIKKAMLIRFLAGLIFVAIFLLSSHKVISLFKLPVYSAGLFSVVALIILFDLESQLLGDAALLALLQNKYWNFSKIAYSAIKFILFYYVILNGYGLVGIIWAWLIVEALLFLLFAIRANMVIFSLPLKEGDTGKRSGDRVARFGGYIYLSHLAYFFRDKAGDVFLLSYFLGVQAVGLYSFAFGIPNMLLQFSIGNKLKNVLNPLIVRRYTMTNCKADLSYYFKFLNRIIFFAMVPVFITSIILADKIILFIFRPEYAKVTGLFMISLGFMAIQQFAFPYSSILITLEKGKVIFISGVISLYNLILDLILIPIFGVFGAILATGSAGLLLIIYYYFVTRKDVTLLYPWRSFAKYTFNILPAGVIVFFMRSLISNFFSLCLAFAMGAVIYLIASYFNTGFEERDRQIINRAIGKRIWVF